MQQIQFCLLRSTLDETKDLHKEIFPFVFFYAPFSIPLKAIIRRWEHNKTKLFTRIGRKKKNRKKLFTARILWNSKGNPLYVCASTSWECFSPFTSPRVYRITRVEGFRALQGFIDGRVNLFLRGGLYVLRFTVYRPAINHVMRRHSLFVCMCSRFPLLMEISLFYYAQLLNLFPFIYWRIDASCVKWSDYELSSFIISIITW